METLTLNFTLLVAMVLGLTQMVKQTISTKYIPFIALVIGVGASFLFGGVDKASVINGIIAALSAMGLYSGTSTTVRD